MKSTFLVSSEAPGKSEGHQDDSDPGSQAVSAFCDAGPGEQRGTGAFVGEILAFYPRLRLPS